MKAYYEANKEKHKSQRKLINKLIKDKSKCFNCKEKSF